MPTYPEEVRRAERAEIRKRYRRPRGAGFPLPVRIRDIDLFLTHFYRGQILPDDDSARQDIFTMLNHLAHLNDAEPRIRDWCFRRAPWLTVSEIEAITATVALKPLRWTAASLGRRLNLTFEDRERLRITTISATDLSKEQIAEIRKERKREAAEAKRRAGGAVPLAQLRAQAVSNTKPWEKMNISRRTWYRLRSVARGTTA